VAPQGQDAYLGAMRLFNFKDISPVGAVGDFVEQWRQPTPYRWQILGLAVALTFTMLILFMPETQRAPPKHPDVIWINSWPADRTEQEIIASNIANQKRKDAAAARAQQQEEQRKEFFRDLARATGMDPDKLERQFSDDEAAPKNAPAKQPAAPAAAKPAEPPAK
jgi:hypothetical protein